MFNKLRQDTKKIIHALVNFVIPIFSKCLLINKVYIRVNFAKTDNYLSLFRFIFRNHAFLLCIPNNVNQTAVGLF